MHAHHIVQSLDPGSAAARDLLDKYQIDINVAANGVDLTRSQHYIKGLHSDATMKRVTDRLKKAVRGIDDWNKARQEMLDELDVIRQIIKDGGLP